MCCKRAGAQKDTQSAGGPEGCIFLTVRCWGKNTGVAAGIQGAAEASESTRQWLSAALLRRIRCQPGLVAQVSKVNCFLFIIRGQAAMPLLGKLNCSSTGFRAALQPYDCSLPVSHPPSVLPGGTPTWSVAWLHIHLERCLVVQSPGEVPGCTIAWRGAWLHTPLVCCPVAHPPGVLPAHRAPHRRQLS